MDDSTHEVREATEKDLPELASLLSQLTSTSPDTVRSVYRRMWSYPNFRIYVAVAGVRLIGTFALLILDNYGHDGAPIAVIENVVVDRDSRRQGVGRLMLEFAASRSRDAGCYKMILASNTRLTDAHRFYETLGFTRQGYAFSLEPPSVANREQRCSTEPSPRQGES